MLAIDTVLVKVASRCNINCRYCYVYSMGDTRWATMPKHISDTTTTALAKVLGDLSRAQQRRFAVVFHGGEPLLLGPKKLAILLAALRRALPSDYPFSLQTNGILITEEILDLCSEYRTSLGVSIDGPPDVNDRYRIDHAGKGTHEKILKGIEKLQNHRDSDFLYTGLLAVIDPESDPYKVYNFFKTLNAPSLELLYRDGNHSQFPYGKASFQSTEYGQWLTVLLDIYLADPKPLRIRLLDDMIKLVLGGYGTKEGMGTSNYGIIVIDTDGSVTKNDTLKSAFNGADRFTQQWSILTHALPEVANSSEFSRYYTLQHPTASACLSCPELSICGGGMPIHRWREDSGYHNPSVYCADQLFLIENIRDRIAALLVSHGA